MVVLEAAVPPWAANPQNAWIYARFAGIFMQLSGKTSAIGPSIQP
jgi:hypothetical protein